MLPSDISFRANPDERRTGPREPSPLLGSRLYIAFFGACLFHAGVLLFLLVVNWEPVVEVAPQEIPVEIVVEPPPQEKPEPPPPAPSAPPTRSIDEDPAFDAPRAANNEKTERDAPDQASKAPPTPTPTSIEKPGAGAAPGGETGPVRQGELQAADHAAEPAMDKPDAEVVKKPELDRDKSEQQQASVDANPEPQKLPSLVGQSLPSWSSGQLPTFESMPDVELAGAAKASPIDGGKAKTTYLTILYGLVMARMHLPPSVHANSNKLDGVLLFSVDGTGNLTQNQILRSSGSRDLDAAAVAAVNKAAPFPTPPQGEPIGLRFTYSAK
jgi:TonB family protein